MRKTTLIGALAAFLLCPVAASAATLVFQGQLLASAENPPVASSGSGAATVSFDDVTNELTVAATFTGLTGTTTVAHIHCCAATLANNAGVATQTPTFSLFPAGVTSGVFSQTLDLDDPTSFNAAFITNNGGTVSSAIAALLAGLVAGQAYFNVHTTFAPGGELRANLAQVPIPGAVFLFAAGLAGMIGARRGKAPV
ncbi:MAG: CHRD domain-containing protein [Parvularculaceae bacterium]